MTKELNEVVNQTMRAAKYYEDNIRSEDSAPKSAEDWKKIVIGDLLGMASILAAADGKITKKELSTADILFGTFYSITLNKFLNTYDLMPDLYYNSFFREHVKSVEAKFNKGELPLSVKNMLDMYFFIDRNENNNTEITARAIEYFDNFIGQHICALATIAQSDKKLKQSELNVIEKYCAIFENYISNLYKTNYSVKSKLENFTEIIKKNTKYYPND